jgi:cardiolipin synthase A/B
MEIRTGRRRSSDAITRAASTAGCALLLAALAACEAPNREVIEAEEPVSSARVAARDNHLVPAGTGASGYGAFSHHLNSTGGFLGNLPRTYATDPLVRPVSIVRSLEFLIDGEEYFPALIQGIENANKSIHLRTYFFDNDDFATGIADLLKHRSNDIDVKVLMDGIGTLTGALGNPDAMPASLDPPPSIAEYLSSGSEVGVRTLTNPWFSGDHTKVTILDRKLAFVGGMNIGREYRYDWHDLTVKVKGGVVEELAREGDDARVKSGMLGDLAAFFRYLVSPKPSILDDGYSIRVLVTRTQHSQIYETQLAAIRRAQKYIYIENPYLSDDTVLFELIAARRRGVDVRFIIAEKGDAMLSNGIRVYVYPRMTHVKAAMVDDWIMVGSANLDKLSMRVKNEVNIATSHPQAVTEVKERLFQANFDKSTELEKQLPAGFGYYLAEAVADVFM